MLLDVADDFLWISLVLSWSHFVRTFLLLALLFVSPCLFSSVEEVSHLEGSPHL